MKKPFCAALLAVQLLPVAAWGQAAAAATVPATAEAPKAARYELKNKSSFTLARDRRSPFWPIGWVKGAGTPTAPALVLDERAFNLTSILLGAQALAIINGRTYSEGELIRPGKDMPSQPVRVLRISDGSVTLQCEGQTLVVTQRRPELQDRKPESELLNDQKPDLPAPPKNLPAPPKK